MMATGSTQTPSMEEVRALFKGLDRKAKNAEEMAELPPGRAKKASVLIPLFYRDGDLRVLLTKRSENLRHHAGYVAFPGGMEDDTDGDEVETALREAEEEIGLKPLDVDVLAVLTLGYVRPNRLVSPVLAFIPSDFQPKINHSEVEFVFDLPLSRFLSEDRRLIQNVDLPENEVSYNVYHYIDTVEGQEVDTWGFTASYCAQVALVAFQTNDVFIFYNNVISTKDTAFRKNAKHVLDLFKANL